MSYPPQLTLKTFLDASYRVEWWTNLLTTEPYRFTYEDPGVPRSQLTAVKGFTDPTMTFADLAWMREAWGGPIPLKGIQTVDDALRAVDAGVEAVVILDGRRPHAMLTELFTEHGSGTLIRA